MKPITIRDVAKLAGVSLGTTSRVINGVPNVEESNRIRVLDAIKQLGFVPSRAAREVKSKRSREIGVIIRDITIPVLAGFVKAAQGVFEEAGYVLLISGAEDRREREIELLERFLRRQVEGLVMVTSAEGDKELAEARRRLGLPIVLFDRDSDDVDDCLLVEHDEGTRQATSHLLRLGHRRILHITGRVTTHPARSRVHGYKQAFTDADIPLVPELMRSTGFDASSAFREASALLEGKAPPTAIIAGGIDMLPGILKAIRSRRLRIPQDISVVASGDSDLALLATPSISVVRWDYVEMGITCAHLLLERINAQGELAQRKIRFATEFVVRDSCGSVPTSEGID